MEGLLSVGADPLALLNTSSTADPQNTIRATLTRGVGQAKQSGIAVPRQLRALIEAAGLGEGVRYGSGLTPEQEAVKAEQERLAALEQAHRDQQNVFQSQLLDIQTRREKAEENWKVKQVGFEQQRDALEAAWKETQKGFEARRESADIQLQTIMTSLDSEEKSWNLWYEENMKPLDDERNEIMKRREKRQEEMWVTEGDRVRDQMEMLNRIAENTAAGAYGPPQKDLREALGNRKFYTDPETGEIRDLGEVGSRAFGGSVVSGQPYIVGERGPELFIPRKDGGVIPNNKIGGTTIIINTDGTHDGRKVARTVAKELRRVGHDLGARLP